MRQRRTVEEPPPPRTDRPLRQVVPYLTITYGLALAIALALPRADIAALISIAVTTIILTAVLLGEEIGWRGYLLFRLAELTGIRDDGDRGRDHDHHGHDSGLSADPPGRRLRQGGAKVTAADHQIARCCIGKSI
jgi:hypothetical protein